MTTINIAELPVAEKLRLMEKLWDAIFETVRIKGDNTAVAAWRQTSAA